MVEIEHHDLSAIGSDLAYIWDEQYPDAVRPPLLWASSAIDVLEAFAVDFMTFIFHQTANNAQLAGVQTITPRHMRQAVNTTLQNKEGMSARLLDEEKTFLRKTRPEKRTEKDKNKRKKPGSKGYFAFPNGNSTTLPPLPLSNMDDWEEGCMKCQADVKGNVNTMWVRSNGQARWAADGQRIPTRQG